MAVIHGKIAIIGAGISGLATAWRLQKLGYDVTLLEKESRTGGVIKSEWINGYLCEHAANEIQLKSEEMELMLQEIGLGEAICQENPNAKNRYIVKKGKLLKVPSGPFGFLLTPLFSVRGKFRLFLEPFIAPYKGDDESVAHFVKRRLGQDFLDYAIAPLVSGVCAGDPSRVSFRHQFPRLWVVEDTYGSLVGGMIRRMREHKKKGIKRYKYKLITFADGIEQLPKALSKHLDGKIHLNAEVTSIENDPWKISWKSNGKTFEERFDAVVSAIPAYAYPELPLPDKLHELLAELKGIEYAKLSTVITGIDQTQVAHKLDGFGFLASPKASCSTLGTIFSSSLFEGRAPKGKVHLVTFVGGCTKPKEALLSEENIQQIVRADLEQLLGVSGAFELFQRNTWEHALPQYNVGHSYYINTIEAAERRFKGFFLTGNFRGGAGVGDVILNASKTAYRVDEYLEQKENQPSS
ncbi:MAG: protoporphyrinogen oxidase [Opitutales bacterium]|nr:protoporphyrinogen oxidase [Opitutales bacterium]